MNNTPWKLILQIKENISHTAVHSLSVLMLNHDPYLNSSVKSLGTLIVVQLEEETGVA